MDEFEIESARAIVAAITEALHERDKCLIALSGGHTPRGVYHRVGDLLIAQSVDLRRVCIIFADERMVPPDDAASNYGMIQRELLSRISVPALNVQRIRGEANPEEAAREYERQLDDTLSQFAGRIDLTVLGVGEDGHTASLFPGTEVLRERHRMVRAVNVIQLDSWRVTLTLPVINGSRAVLFLATGERKAGIVGKILACTESSEDMPATLVRSGITRWMLDAKAASQLPADRFAQGRTVSNIPHAE